MFKEHGRSLARTPDFFQIQRDPADIIHWDPSKYQTELDQGLRIHPSTPDWVRSQTISIIQRHWDSFCEEGMRRPILGIEFHIDTGDAQPIAVKMGTYGPLESFEIMKQVNALHHNGLIRLCGGPWAFRIVLAPKPHQEKCFDIQEFIWRMCINYRPLNAVTLPFAYPIPRCDDAISDFGVGCIIIFFISLDARSGFHQIKVAADSQEKLAFMAPDFQKYTFDVLPFGPMNGPPVYTAMMVLLQRQWHALAEKVIRAWERKEAQRLALEGKSPPPPARFGSKIIIDDILIWASLYLATLLYFDCVCQIFDKHRVSFKLEKCEFFYPRVEYVGHDLTAEGQHPARSKYQLIADWALPATARNLQSFVSLCGFYQKYQPWFEIHIKGLRRLIGKYRGDVIPLMAWSPALLHTFNQLKQGLTSSPCLARPDPSKPFFLKTDWSRVGMGYILMQPDDSPAAAAATAALDKGKYDLFDVRRDGARLRPVAFGARKCDERESHFHSIVGEAAAGRYAIGKERKWLWGNQFYWVCDCSAVRAIMNYEGTNYMLSRWAQELLGYHFICLHRPARMMQDVDGIARHPDPLIDSYEHMAAQLNADSKRDAPDQYEPASFPPPVRTRRPTSPAHVSMALVRPSPAPFHVQPVKAIPCYRTTAPIPSADTALAMRSAVLSSHPTWLSCNPSFVSSIDAVVSRQPGTQFIIAHQCRHLGNAITRARAAEVLMAVPYDGLTSQFVHNLAPTERLAGYDAHCHEHFPSAAQHWLSHQSSVLSHLVKHHHLECYFLTLRVNPANTNQQPRWTPPSLAGTWTHQDVLLRTSEFGDCVAALRRVVYGHLGSTNTSPLQPPTQQDPVGFGDLLPFHVDPASWTQAPVVTAIAPVPSTSQFLPQVTHIATTPGRSYIPCYDLAHPAPEWCLDQEERQSPGFSVLNHDANGSPALYPVTAQDFGLFLGYDSADSAAFAQLPEHSQDRALRYCTPPASLAAIMDTLHPAPTDSKPFPAAALTATVAPSSLDWTTAYAQDPETSLILSHIQDTSKPPTTEVFLRQLHADYRLPLRENRIILQSGRLMLLRPVTGANRSLALLIVPSSLRSTVFSAYHAAPTTGHMDVYKTLHRLRLRFFWPTMSSFVRQAIKRCPHCILANSTQSDAASLMYSFPMSEPFYLLFADLWTPGVTRPNMPTEYWLIAMEDITGAVIPVKVGSGPHASLLAELFMRHIILRVGLCSAVCIDDDGKFKGFFKSMCEALQLRYIPLAKGNHQGMRVERFNRFLNKVCTIVANDRDHMPSSAFAVDVAAYAWNSAPIEGTDVVRSLPAFGRIFRFPFDVELAQLPTPTDDCAVATTDFLNATAATKHLATDILSILKEDRITAHRERINLRRREATFKVGDHVTVRVQTQSNADTGRPKKLLYKASGPFEITEDLGHGAYHVRRAGNPHAALRKQHARDMFLLPPELNPCEPLDAADLRYINFERSPLTHPLLANLDIESYNTKWLPTSQLRVSPPTPPSADLAPHQFPTVAVMNQDMLATNPGPASATPSCPVSQSHDASSEPSNTTTTTMFDHQDVVTLDETIKASKDRLFFISYTPHGVLRPNWHLVAVDLDESQAALTQGPNGIYTVDFFIRPQRDRYLSDVSSRWWPEWREFHWSKDESYIELGDRVEIAPGSPVNTKKYVKFSLEVDLSDPNIYLHGPFDFQPHHYSSPRSRPGEKIATTQWKALASCVHGRGIPAPLLTDITREYKRRKRGRGALRTLVSTVLQRPISQSAFISFTLAHTVITQPTAKSLNKRKESKESKERT